MALPTSGALSLDAMHVEAGGTTNTTVSLNDTDIRGLISKGSATQMSFNEWYGASSGFSITNTVGAGTGVFVTYKYRGFAVDNALLNGGPYGSLSSRQNSNFFGNNDIDLLTNIAALSGTPFNSKNGRMLIRVGTTSSVANNNDAFESMTVNGTQFNRSDATYSSSQGQWIWDYTISSVPNDATSAIEPFPATGQTCTISFTGGT